MTQHAYSWKGSRIHVVLEEKVADAYNRAMDEWYEAQRRHHEWNEKPWDPETEPIEFHWSEEEQKAWDGWTKVFQALVELNGGGFDIPDEELTSEYFVKLN